MTSSQLGRSCAEQEAVRSGPELTCHRKGSPHAQEHAVKDLVVPCVHGRYLTSISGRKGGGGEDVGGSLSEVCSVLTDEMSVPGNHSARGKGYLTERWVEEKTWLLPFLF